MAKSYFQTERLCYTGLNSVTFVTDVACGRKVHRVGNMTHNTEVIQKPDGGPK